MDAHSTAGRQLGLSEAGLVEAVAAMELFSGLCAYANGRALEAKDA